MARTGADVKREMRILQADIREARLLAQIRAMDADRTDPTKSFVEFYFEAQDALGVSGMCERLRELATELQRLTNPQED